MTIWIYWNQQPNCATDGGLMGSGRTRIKLSGLNQDLNSGCAICQRLTESARRSPLLLNSAITLPDAIQSGGAVIARQQN
ncbi:hypothetical protein SEESL791_016420 [Salmonella enterica subsp. enterica serovar Sloterdijk str. ATCC 15791]|nr:hypothetical protein SEESL791_016420 [Salmonella enterica subsp. enterica serovar Sloterdijk str. ATCC 15791]